MHPQLKKFITIILAVLFGATIIFLVLNKNKFSFENPSSATDNKWLDTLVVVPSQRPFAQLGTEYSQSGATSTTDFIARELVAGYAEAQIKKGDAPLSDAEIQEIVQTLSEKARAVDTIKQYTEQDLTIVSSSTSTLATYQKELTSVLNASVKKELANELMLVAQAVDNNDASRLALLADNIATYQTLVVDLVALSVPHTLLAFHLSLTQGYTNMLSGIADMQEILADPARGIRGVAKYKNGVGLIDTAIAMVNTKK